MNILMTGGSGILGQELQKYFKCWAPSRKKFDIRYHIVSLSTSEIRRIDTVELIVHAAAFTDLVLAEKEKELCYDTNVIGTRNLASLGIPMLYISTEYVFDGEKGSYSEEDFPNPQNFYALTKLLGEYESRKSPKSVVIRTLFKSRPFKHDAACVDQFTTGSYVDIIAPEIIFAIKNFDKLPETINIGIGKKSMFELAKESKPNIQFCRIADIKTVKLPRDTSLNCKKWEGIKNGSRTASLRLSHQND